SDCRSTASSRTATSDMSDQDPVERVDGALERVQSAAGASAMAALPIVGGPVAAFVTQLALDRHDRAIDAVETAISTHAQHAHVTVEEVLERAEASPRLRALIDATLEAALAFDDEHHRRVAASILRGGLDDDACVDEARFLAGSLRRLEPS